LCEPIHHFRLEGPADTLGGTMAMLARLAAVPLSQEMRGTSYVLEGEIRVARLHELQQRVPRLTRGEGVMEHAFARYEPRV
jgi:ribosomal protection tetracycline resistance protein